jgi:hypothetical protein
MTLAGRGSHSFNLSVTFCVENLSLRRYGAFHFINTGRDFSFIRSDPASNPLIQAFLGVFPFPQRTARISD